MNDFGARFSITDQMTPVLRKINEAMKLMNDNLAAVHKATNIGMDSSTHRKVFEITQDINKELDYFEDQQRRIADNQERVTKSFKDSQKAAEGLGGKLSTVFTAYTALQIAGKIKNLSDNSTAVAARLNLISDGNTQGLQKNIFFAAQSSRGNYMDMQSVIAKLGINAGDKFNSNAEIVRFVELLNKNFIVSGSSSGEKSAAMYQLTQAMASGALQGDEFRSIRENAPLLAQSIEDYMLNVEGVTGSMKDWSSQGLITAEVIKNAMFYSADEVEARFEQMPMTISQIGTVAYNSFIEKAQPLFNLVNDVANFTYKNWDMISKVVPIASAAVMGYVYIANTAKEVDRGATIIKGIKNTRTMLSAKYTKDEANAALKAANAENLSAAAKARLAVAAGTATVGQKMLNAAMWACPVLAVVGGVVALVGALGNFYDTEKDVTDQTQGVTAELENLDKTIAAMDKASNVDIKVGLKLSEVEGYKAAAIAQAEWKQLQKLMARPLMDSNANDQLKVMNFYLEDIKDKVPGLDAATIAFDGMYASIKGVNGQMSYLINNYANLAKTKAYVNAYQDKLQAAVSKEIDAKDIMESADKFVYKKLSYSDWLDTPEGQKAKTDAMNFASVEQAAGIKSDRNFDKLVNKKLEAAHRNSTLTYTTWSPEYSQASSDYYNALKEQEKITASLTGYMQQYAVLGGTNNPLTDIANDTSTIAKSVIASKEDLKYLRDIAERETVNRFTTAEVMINLGGINQTVNSESDLDGIVTYLAEQLTEQLQIAADGVHA